MRAFEFFMEKIIIEFFLLQFFLSLNVDSTDMAQNEQVLSRQVGWFESFQFQYILLSTANIFCICAESVKCRKKISIKTFAV